MGLQIDYEISEQQIKWPMTIAGLFFLGFRLFCMSVFIQEDGSFHPKALHTSYFISILLGLTLIFNFRVKVLNAVPIAVLPSVIFTLFLHDIGVWVDPSSVIPGDHQVGGFLWWNFLTIHTPIPFFAGYVYATRKESLSLESYFLAFFILILWFIPLDDMENGTIDGMMYILLAIPILIVWTMIYWKWICRDVPQGDPLIAKMVDIKSIKWV